MAKLNLNFAWNAISKWSICGPEGEEPICGVASETVYPPHKAGGLELFLSIETQDFSIVDKMRDALKNGYKLHRTFTATEWKSGDRYIFDEYLEPYKIVRCDKNKDNVWFKIIVKRDEVPDGEKIK